RFTLSEQSRNVVDRLSVPVKITTLFRESSESRGELTLASEVHSLLAEYAARTHEIELHRIDVDADPGEVERLADHVGKKRLARDPVVLECQDRSRVLNSLELVRTHHKTVNGRRITLPSDFIAEQSITSALVALTNREPMTVYFATGHGE